eukprot:6371875-Amphidinium_carterae.1
MAQEAEAKAVKDFNALKAGAVKCETAAKEDEIALGDKAIAEIDETYAAAEAAALIVSWELMNSVGCRLLLPTTGEVCFGGQGEGER